ncbi:substrate-binding domain-containing protein [Streptomyces sp. TRM72054]|uniref:caspase family protein n=1 Tax=Streptomyces sp. TRM72054 TaxID=2870562 RepID=UPI001C8B105E|nr:caspase family protein [Streptomyces sp. TRM72054]MBX9396416.1 substrate-binding domain-containing protein [Streptomyces sp. TRM72054]
MTRFDPRGRVNRALLVGVSTYDFTEPPHGVPGDLPAVEHNLDRLRDTLARGGVFAADQITVERSPSLDDFDRALRTAAEEAEGLLLLYFAGHGAIPSAGDELFLQMRNASVIAGGHAVFPGAEMFTTVLTWLASSPAERIVVILDCCFAGNAAWIWEHFRDKRRVLLLMSVQANHRTDAGDGGTPTPFTGVLLHLLDAPGELGFRDVSDALRKRMAEGRHETLRKEPWTPQSRAEHDEDVLLSAREEQGVPLTRPGPGAVRPPQQPPPTHHRVGPVPPGPLTARLRRLPGVLRAARSLACTTVLLSLTATGLGVYGLLALVGGSAACAPPLELRVLTDPDLEATVGAAADAYLTSQANTTGDGCRRSGITVYSAGSAAAVTALRHESAAWHEPRNEDLNPQRDIGPQPDVWIPASRADVARVTTDQDTDVLARLEPDDRALAYSPIVLAVPTKLAATSLDERVGGPLTGMLDTLRERHEDAEVRRPDPEFADAALLATIGLYGTGADPGRVEQQLAVPGPPSPTAAELLCALPDDDAADHRTAALVPEFLMKSGVGCDRTTRSPRTAQYPGDVPGLEPVFVRVRWEGADRDRAARDEAAGDFRAWLAGEGGRAAFGAAGFRAATGDRALLDPDEIAEGVLPAPSLLIESAGRDAMETALRKYRDARGPGRALFLLDSSGSMAGLWQGPSGGPGLLKQSLGGLGRRDEYGVWAVAETGGRSYETLLPFGPHSRRSAEAAIDAGARVRDAEADPYAALVAALDHMAERGAADDRPQLIVLITDDEDAGRLTGARLDDLLSRARLTNVPITMVSLANGGCAAGKPDALIAVASGGRCLDADDELGTGLSAEVARTGTGEQ